MDRRHKKTFTAFILFICFTFFAEQAMSLTFVNMGLYGGRAIAASHDPTTGTYAGSDYLVAEGYYNFLYRRAADTAWTATHLNANGNIADVQVSPKDGTVFVLYNSTLYFSTDGGVTFTAATVTTGTQGVTAFFVDLDGLVYAATGGSVALELYTASTGFSSSANWSGTNFAASVTAGGTITQVQGGIRFTAGAPYMYVLYVNGSTSQLWSAQKGLSAWTQKATTATDYNRFAIDQRTKSTANDASRSIWLVSSAGTSLYTSTDGGATITTTATTFGTGGIFYNAANNLLLCASLYSTDGGATWNNLPAGSSNMNYTLYVHPKSSTVTTVLIGSDIGIAKADATAITTAATEYNTGWEGLEIWDSAYYYNSSTSRTAGTTTDTTIFAASKSGLAMSSTGGSSGSWSWKAHGDTYYTTATDPINYNPTASSVYVVSGQSRFSYSTDNATTLTQITTGFSNNTRVKAVSYKPRSHSGGTIFYAGYTGDTGSGGTVSGGVKSFLATGSTLTDVGSPVLGKDVSSLLSITLGGNEYLYAGLGNSGDAGGNLSTTYGSGIQRYDVTAGTGGWTDVSSAAAGNIIASFASDNFLTPTYIIAGGGTSTTGKVFCSTDGTTWTDITPSTVSSFVYDVESTRGGIIWIATSNFIYEGSVSSCTVTWSTPVTATFAGNTIRNLMVIGTDVYAVSKQMSTPQTFFAALSGMFESVAHAATTGSLVMGNSDGAYASSVSLQGNFAGVPSLSEWGMLLFCSLLLLLGLYFIGEGSCRKRA